MSSAVRLPSELTEFLALKGPQTLLVRGAPGSGKSTLCLALLEAAQGERLLVTNRVSTPELHREFPWLGDNGSHGIRVVDTSSPDVYIADSLRAAALSSEVVDDSPRARKELEEFFALPPPIQEAWSQLPPNRPALVVVDSWDALVEQYLGGHSHGRAHGYDRPEVERILLRKMGQTSAHLVLVLERREETHLDYLVNGVLVAERDSFQDRLERWIRLPKLRGIRVENASYPFTVEGAKFQCIEPIRRYSEIRPGPFEKEPDELPGFLWPGSQNFAEAFGRFAVGKSTLFETDAEFPDAITQVVLGPAIGASLSRGGRVLLIPSPGLSPEDIWTSISSSHVKNHVADSLRIVDVTGQFERTTKAGRPELSPAVLAAKALMPGQPDADPADSELGRFLRGGAKSGPPSLAVAYLSGLKALLTTLKVPMTAEMVEGFPASVQLSLGTFRYHFIAAGGPDNVFFEALKPLADVHVRFRVRQGRAFLYGAKPWTPGFVLAESSNGAPYGLLRIV